MSNTKISLSPAQREILTRSLKYEGRIPRSCSITTERILEGYGFIAKGNRIRDEQERKLQDEEIGRIVKQALVELNSGDWVGALRCLEGAYALKGELTATCCWITDAGREAVKP